MKSSGKDKKPLRGTWNLVRGTGGAESNRLMILAAYQSCSPSSRLMFSLSSSRLAVLVM